MTVSLNHSWPTWSANVSLVSHGKHRRLDVLLWRGKQLHKSYHAFLISLAFLMLITEDCTCARKAMILDYHLCEVLSRSWQKQCQPWQVKYHRVLCKWWTSLPWKTRKGVCCRCFSEKRNGTSRRGLYVADAWLALLPQLASDPERGGASHMHLTCIYIIKLIYHIQQKRVSAPSWALPALVHPSCTLSKSGPQLSLSHRRSSKHND